MRNWVNAQRTRPDERVAVREFTIESTLVRLAANYSRPRLTVSPLEVDDRLIWIDPAGYTVARSDKPRDWPDKPSTFEFELDVSDATVVGTAYLRHER